MSGLTRGDFVVKEDGRPQAITAFEAVEAVVPALVSPETIASSPSRSRVATNVAEPPTRRTFAIVFDDLHVGDINVEQAKRAVETFVVRQTVSGDRLVLATVSDARFWATTRGGEEAAWREALSRVRSHAPLHERPGCEPTYYEAMQIDALGNKQVADLVQRRYAALCVPPTMRASPDQLARSAIASEMARMGVSGSSGSSGPQSGPPAARDGGPLTPSAAEAFSRYRGRLSGTLRVVRQIIVKLGETAGRKALVLVTEGFPADTSLDAFREVREQAARANVVIHFLDARGLAVGPDFLSAAGSTGIISGPDVGPTVALWKLEDGGSKALADETGGLVLQTNDLASGLTKVAEESRVTYLLGYEPTNDKRDGRYRKLSVEVRRPGLQVRARSGYFAAKGADKPAPKPTPVQRALREIFDSDGIPLRLAAYVMGPAAVQSPLPKAGLEVLIAGELRLDALDARVQNGRRVAQPRLELRTGSRGGESHESTWTLELALSSSVSAADSGAPAAGEALWHPFVTRIAMTPGEHRARLVVQSGERVGSVTVDFVVPPVGDERLSTPILSDRLVANASDRQLMPLARRAFAASGTLHCWIELPGAAADATGHARATVAFVARSPDGHEWARGEPVPMNVEGGRPTRLLSVPLADAPPGESELVLRVHDELSGASFESLEPFRVAKLD